MNHPLLETCAELIGRQTPNLFRLYLNPHVVQTCLCLNRYIQDAWYKQNPLRPDYQSFLANSFDEALSGAIKLARYAAEMEGRSQKGLVLDCANRLGSFAAVRIRDEETIEYVPDLVVLNANQLEREDASPLTHRFGFVVLVLSPALEASKHLDEILTFLEQPNLLRIACVDRTALDNCRRSASTLWEKLLPDIVVFDESFTHHDVPFGAFAARKTLYDYWNTAKNATFHSTTYQPNSISSLHFLRCLKRDDPEFYASLSKELDSIRSDTKTCKSLLGKLYSPSLRKTITALGLSTSEVQAAGHYVVAKSRRIFDGVGGVACSMRGHNPGTYVAELAALDHVGDCHEAVAERLRELTGLECLLPAVSGASAVENALRVGLAAQYPKKYVLALKGGFGGKTLLALTGTAKESYKRNLGPLYPHVVYVDPFQESARRDLDAALETYPVGVVQLELIQAVGGVRAVPEEVVRHLDSRRRDCGYLLFVDEVQTGMYRTGSFALSTKMGVAPDILTIGKGSSDMMFPFAATLLARTIQEKLSATQPDLLASLRRRHDYEFGYKTLLNTLTRAEKIGLADRVAESAALFARLLADRFSSCKAVRDVRVFGLLIAIELNTESWLGRWAGGKFSSVYVYNLLRHALFPLFMGYCQYEPHVLKFTPPLSISRTEIEQACETIADVLHKPSYKLLPPVVRALTTTYLRDKWKGR
jgi:acetylornithine/succinyldiaminopimelate/putrescine aminotransferase